LRKFQQESQDITIELSPTESRALRADLGEACFGFPLNNFEAAIGTTKEKAKALLERLNRLDLVRDSELAVSREELRILRNAHREALRDLGVEEYATRTGVEFTDGQIISRELDELVDGASSW